MQKIETVSEYFEKDFKERVEKLTEKGFKVDSTTCGATEDRDRFQAILTKEIPSQEIMCCRERGSRCPLIANGFYCSAVKCIYQVERHKGQ